MHTTTTTTRHAMPTNKAALRAYIQAACAAYLANGGKVQHCKPARARGARLRPVWVQPAALVQAGSRCSTPQA